jgi:hypothetical protein
MKRFARFLSLVAFAVGLSGTLTCSANAAVARQVDANGKLIGAIGVVVNGATWSVEFKDGTCRDLFSGCNQLSDFAMQGEVAAMAASKALLEQVFVNVGPGQLFDSDPFLTNGCSSYSSPFAGCWVFTPYLPAYGTGQVYVAFASNSANLSDTWVNISIPFVGEDLGTRPDQTYAIWKWEGVSNVPEPGSLALALFGGVLLALVLVAKARSSGFRLPCLGAAAMLGALGFVQAHAGEVYVPLGIPGLGIGYAHPINEYVGVRADFMTLGQRDRTQEDSGISYQVKAQIARTALLVDAFPFAGTFRLTGGLVANNVKLLLDASGAGGKLAIGDREYTTTAGDGINGLIQFPSTTPYLGIGWGHQTGNGWRFSADLGAAIGTATVSATARGNLAKQPDIQANLDKELVELRNGVGQVKFIPQISIGIGYSF